jgi:hypothetical protein
MRDVLRNGLVLGRCAVAMARPRASGPRHTARPVFSYGGASRRRRAATPHAMRRRTQRWSW